MLDHDELREELIRQLDAKKFSATWLAQQLGIAPPRVREMRLRTRQIQHGEMARVARILGLDADPDPQAPQFVRLHVALPNADALTRMFETILKNEVPDERLDGIARNLARRLPAALQRSLESPPVPARPTGSAAAADLPPPATRRRPRPPGSRS